MKKSNFILSILIVGVSSYFLFNSIYFYVPNPDVFEYLTEGKIIINYPFSWIATPPAYSVLLHILEKILPFENPGIIGGILFNILSFTLSMVILWKQSTAWLGKFAYLVLLVFIVHPLSSLINLQPMNASPALLLILLVFYLHRRHPILSYIFIVLAFFCRYEAIVLFPIVLLWDLLEYKRLREPLSFLYSSIPVLIWTMRGFYEDTVYRPEYTAGYYNKIPNTEFIINAFSSIILNLKTGSTPIAIFIIVWLTIGILICYKKGIIIPLLYGLFIVGYGIIHTMFPAVVPRYGYLILPFILVLFYWPVVYINQSNRIGKTIISCVLIGLTIFITYRSLKYRDFQTNEQWSRADKRIAGIWLKNNITKPTIVYAFMNDIIGYFAKNSLVEYPQKYNTYGLSQYICDDKKDILIFIDNEITKKRYYYDYADGQDFTSVFMNSEIFPYFHHLETLRIKDYAIKIYRYQAGTKRYGSTLQKLCLDAK